MATPRLKFSILEASIIFFGPSGCGKTPGILPQWNWAGWGGQTPIPTPGVFLEEVICSHCLGFGTPLSPAAEDTERSLFYKLHWGMVSRSSLSAVHPKAWFHHPPHWDFLEHASKEALFFTQCWYFHLPVLPNLPPKKKKELNYLKLLNWSS